jgi:hypothetical protein
MCILLCIVFMHIHSDREAPAMFCTSIIKHATWNIGGVRSRTRVSMLYVPSVGGFFLMEVWLVSEVLWWPKQNNVRTTWQVCKIMQHSWGWQSNRPPVVRAKKFWVIFRTMMGHTDSSSWMTLHILAQFHLCEANVTLLVSTHKKYISYPSIII